MKGYGLAKHPNDSPMDGTIHPIGQAQLRAYEAQAFNWYMVVETIDNREQHCCGQCSQTLWFTADERGRRYNYTEEEMLALRVAHIRQRHSEVVV